MGNLASNWENQSSSLLSAPGYWTATDLDALARELLVKVAATGVAIAQQDSEVSETLVCAVSIGTCVPPRGAQLDPKSGISGRCIREGRTQRSYDACIDPRVERGVIEQLGIRSLVAAPIFAGRRCVGLIEAISHEPGHFDATRVALVESAADAAAELLHAQQKPSEDLIPHSSELPPALDVSQEQHSPSLPNGVEDSTDSELIRSSPVVDANNVPSIDDHPSTWRGKFAFWYLLATVIAIAIIATSYALYRHTLKQSTLSAKRTPGLQSSNLQSADFPALSAAAQSQKRTTVLQTGDGKSGTDSSALSEAASRGVISDQLRLAQAYLEGNGLPRNAEKAASWYIIAGENGSVKAKRRSIEATRGMAQFQIGQIRFDVGKMFMNGIGTRRDNVAAYAWFELAKAAGEVRAQSQEEILESRMQPSQVEEAKRRASTWLQSHVRKVRGPERMKRADEDNAQTR